MHRIFIQEYIQLFSSTGNPILPQNSLSYRLSITVGNSCKLFIPNISLTGFLTEAVFIRNLAREIVNKTVGDSY